VVLVVILSLLALPFPIKSYPFLSQVFNLYVASCHQDYDFYYKQTLISTWAHTFKYGFGILGLLKMARLSYLKYTINKNAELRDIVKSLACTIFIPIGVSVRPL